jgi:oligopeptide/dipeptide ABC transporter ATP-binding protein
MPETLLEVRSLKKTFLAEKPNLFFGGTEKLVHAIDGIDFSLSRGEVLAVVGESGCGKSTLALTLMGLEIPDKGSISFEGVDYSSLDDKGMKKLRRRIQMIFQDPYEALNPTQTIEEIITEPLIVHGMAKGKEQRRRLAMQALDDSGLKPSEIYLERFPHQLSGGQRQRVVIAGALVLEPCLLIADEPVSMLDVSIRAEIINLLAELRQSRQISVIFITHDLGTVGYFADRIAVMYLGRIVEIGPTREILSNAAHPYTKALLSVIPVPNPRLRKQRIILQGETPNPVDIPTGCRFHPRCPIAVDQCKATDPPLVEVVPGHTTACLLAKGR